MGMESEGVASDERFCVRVRNLPGVLSTEAVTALLSHYGATRVRLLQRRSDASSGREPGVVSRKLTQKAMATFTSREAQQSAQRRLHDLELAGHRLQVEVVGDETQAAEKSDAAASITKQPPLPKGYPPPLPPPSSAVVTPAMPPPAPLAPHLGLHYAPSPLLEYKYPRASESTVRNIANALIALPRFYTQVLHLMNKMNLPLPFEEDAIPGRFSKRRETDSHSTDEQQRQQKKRRRRGCDSPDPQIVEEEEEEEEKEGDKLMEREEQTRATPDECAAFKRPRPHDHTEKTAPAAASIAHSSVVAPEAPPEIIGKPLLKQHKRMPVVKSSELTAAFGLATESEHDAQTHRVTRPGVISATEVLRQRLSREVLAQEPLMSSYDRGTPSRTINVQNIAVSFDKKDLSSVFGFVLPLDVPLESMEITLEQVKGSARITFPDEAQALAAVDELHGVLLENKPLIVSFQRDSAATSGIELPARRWTMQELASRRKATSELATEKAMKKYERGDPSTTLYVKNLAKSVELADLHAVFGAVLAPDVGPESLKIRHFTEGRMRCQAFVEYSTVALASDALEHMHGVVLKDKPLVVCFRKPPVARN